ncbi:Enamine deaminase RidA, house cleaning of reactive enamine intermediates, YjgF/YER057c/UK114 family [Polaromonas sp. OV174]|uniref:RidA family protein n=1 Tax=Polaromonas sp. OV174 TaxID=1855300 RepID=UPI0008F33C2A|nr:RidA family protein [Polaromonas sp. OV174]SFC19915.1 Enamine deaminase RidA, house cleaning of reactive enamine intermediates, YjgF/YER057c/UK114 family [Polaromonas sp. OV174]
MSLQRIDTVKRRSEVVVHNNTIYIGGQVAANTQGNIEAQTREVLDALDRLLEQAGSSRNHLLSVRILLRDITDYADMNAVWDEWIPLGHAPTRACTLQQLINPDWRLEIIAVAAKPQE